MDLICAARTATVKAAARAAGFARVGVAPAAAPPRLAAFEAAVAEGRTAALPWLARPDQLAARQDPTRLLPGARAIVMVATRYADGSEPSGGVARYARGRDYHEVLAGRLQLIVDCVTALGGRARPFVDGAAVCEVAHAARAGLGWIGKNTLLLHRDGGSWSLLAGLLTDLELQPDTAEPDHCGRCTRCLDACPTQAFEGPYRLNIARCLSYQTIEQKAAIPTDLRPAQGDWLFGCDVCQEVCPWCRPPDGPPALDPELGRDAGLAAPDPAAWLALPAADLAQRLAGTPLVRPKRRGLLRNACVVLGNRLAERSPDATRYRAALTSALADDEPLVREHAAWALGRVPPDTPPDADTT